MNIRLMIGTNNVNKARELSAMLDAALPGAFSVVRPSGLKIEDEPVEDVATFEANALLKARFYHERSGLMCLADDSGLEVDALDGRPGVYSARYAPSDPERIERLLGEMRGVVEDEKRTARFVCAAALVLPGGGEWVVRGTCEGRISREPAGRNGFGYDPVFLLPERGCTMAQLEPAQKNAISHRGCALEKMLEKLSRLSENLKA